jgi:hypothetical protein
MKIGTLTTGAAVVTTINLNYLPQYINFTAATGLTGIKVTVHGEGVLMDLDTDGIAALSGIRRFGNVTNSYLMALADGFIANKNVELQFTNSAAQTPDIFGFSLQKGSAYVKSVRIKAFANSQVTFENFGVLGFQSTLSDTLDILNIRFVDGHIQQITGTELKTLCTLFMNETDGFLIDNVEGEIDEVTLTAGADRLAYVLSYVSIGQNF